MNIKKIVCNAEVDFALLSPLSLKQISPFVAISRVETSQPYFVKISRIKDIMRLCRFCFYINSGSCMRGKKQTKVLFCFHPVKEPYIGLSETKKLDETIWILA